MLIQNYNPNWKTDFNNIKATLLDKLNSLEINIEHVGSTSVQGMSAKSIIDIDIVYMKSEAFESIKKSLEAIGYYHNGNQEIEGREVFKRISNSGHAVLDRISHHLYVCHKENAEL
ncbi:MAG: GrpB family protein, partial [Ekhidna sp.]